MIFLRYLGYEKSVPVPTGLLPCSCSAPYIKINCKIIVNHVLYVGIIHNQETEEPYEILESCGRTAGLFFAQLKDCLPAVGIVWFSEGRQANGAP